MLINHVIAIDEIPLMLSEELNFLPGWLNTQCANFTLLAQFTTVRILVVLEIVNHANDVELADKVNCPFFRIFMHAGDAANVVSMKER